MQMKIKVFLAVVFSLLLTFGAVSLAEDRVDVYEWDWYQQPAEKQEGKAYLEFWTPTSPAQLIENTEREVTPYVWNTAYTVTETNQIDFTVERVTEVYFTEDHKPSDVYAMTGEACVAFCEAITIPGGTGFGYTINRPVSADIGYGVAVSGKDAKGNELTFGFYIPLSQEVQKTYTVDMLKQTAEPEEGKAFMVLTPSENPATLLNSTEYFPDGGYGWFYGFTIQNKSDVPFTATEMLELQFKGDAIMYENRVGTDFFKQWGYPDVYEGDAVGEYGGGLPALSGHTGMGYVLRGVDANGNELEFYTFIDLEQKKED